MQQLDPEDLLLVAYERLLPLAPDRLQLAAPSPTALMPIDADPDRLQQCLAALVENAIAYGSGPIQLFVTAEPERIVLHVQDQGAGISDQEKAKVLERFTRGSTATGTRGSGLGLSLVQQLISLMGADLVIADAPGGGADVQLRFQRLENDSRNSQRRGLVVGGQHRHGEQHHGRQHHTQKHGGDQIAHRAGWSCFTLSHRLPRWLVDQLGCR